MQYQVSYLDRDTGRRELYTAATYLEACAQLSNLEELGHRAVHIVVTFSS